MNQIKNALGGSSGHNSSQQQPPGQKEDYGDKVFAAGLKKTGHDNIDRNTQEKITDGIREGYEKMSGHKVNPKFSN